MQQVCPKCEKNHTLYYLIKINNTRAMFILCSKQKSRGLPFTIFLPLRENLDIPTFLNRTKAYEDLKASVQNDGEFSDEERRIISQWKRASLVPRQMTKEQLQMIKRYVKGNIVW